MLKRLRIEKFSGIVIFVIISMIVLEFLFIFRVVQTNFKSQQDQELARYVSLVSQSLEDAFELTKDYEALQNENLYEKSKNLRFELKDIEAIDVTSDQLEKLKSKYGVKGLAILAPTNDNVMILNSTVRDEVGDTTETWGYWNKAFNHLLNEEPVAVKKGQSFEEFWVGPKSMSYYYDGYFRYGYIYQPKGHYLINLFVEDNNLIAAKAAGSVNSRLADIRDNVDYIDHIGVVNAETLKEYRSSDYENSGNDPLVLYGDIENTGFTKINYDVDNLMNSGVMFNESLGRNSQQLILKKLNDNELLVIVINSHNVERITQTLMFVTLILAVIAGVVILVVNFWMIRKYGALLNIERDRLSLAESFQKTIQGMPSMIYHCKLSKEGDILLSYNDGKYFSKEDVVLTDAKPVSMSVIYPQEYMKAANSHIMKAFSNGRSRFEASMDGHVFDVIVSPVLESGLNEKTGQVREIIGFGTEISERVSREKSAEFLATHDLLTNLPNRLSFKRVLESGMSADRQLCVIYFDLDDFKNVNDTHGHQIGDEVLMAVANRMNLFTNDALKMARMGGDEFVACSLDLSLDEVKVLTGRIIDAICKPIEIEGIVCQIGASAGISQYPVDGTTAEALISQADKAMYESKAEGGNSYKVS